MCSATRRETAAFQTDSVLADLANLDTPDSLGCPEVLASLDILDCPEDHQYPVVPGILGIPG